MSQVLTPDLMCPVDNLYPITLTVQTIPGFGVTRIDWVCTNNPAHKGSIFPDPTPPSRGISSTAAQNLPNTQPPTRQFR